MSKFPEQSLDSIADLSIEDRHAIVIAWLNTLTTIYEKTAATRDEALDACKHVLNILDQRHVGEPWEDTLRERLRPIVEKVGQQ